MRAARPQARFLELVHRLDRDTSGVLLVAKKRAALAALHEAWREGAVDKRYQVLVRGAWRDALRRVSLELHKYVDGDGERRVRVNTEGQERSTIFRRMEVWPRHDPPLALLEAELRTGRTHRYRVHLTQLGFPLAGDDKYGDFTWNRALTKQGLKRMFLHAATLSLAHPVTGVPLNLVAPLPADLAAFLSAWRAGNVLNSRRDATGCCVRSGTGRWQIPPPSLSMPFAVPALTLGSWCRPPTRRGTS